MKTFFFCYQLRALIEVQATAGPNNEMKYLQPLALLDYSTCTDIIKSQGGLGRQSRHFLW